MIYDDNATLYHNFLLSLLSPFACARTFREANGIGAEEGEEVEGEKREEKKIQYFIIAISLTVIC